MQDLVGVISMAFVLMGVCTLLVMGRPLFRVISSLCGDAICDAAFKDADYRRLQTYSLRAAMALVSLAAGIAGFRHRYVALGVLGAITTFYLVFLWARELFCLEEKAERELFGHSK